MCFKNMHLLTAILLLRLPGLLCGPSVSYSSTRVCGLKGASVVLPCKYYYPWGHIYKGGEWYKKNTGRFREHSNSKYPDCSLKLDNLSNGQSGVYQFRFWTSLHWSWITGSSAVTLSVTDLQVKAVVGNQNQINVTCSTSCSLGSQYVWYKNGQPLRGNTTALMTLTSTSPSDVANYSCAVKGHEGYRSPAVSLQVSISPEAVTEGVTLTWHTTYSPEKISDMVLPASITICIILALLLVLGIVYLRKKHATITAGGRSTDVNMQSDAGLVYSNVTARATTSDPTQRVTTHDQDDIQYASIQIDRSKRQEVPLYSDVQMPQTSAQDDYVAYASVQFHRGSAATRAEDDSVIYSTAHTP
ncbi:uncharacterized protein LOC143106523 [Alosa pseudoharengus]|uniref:uncharacterized protein LOC143106523 n=1 Tax=Alosa pseudoharengus TaxID=34774 RepID=UPI003F891314